MKKIFFVTIIFVLLFLFAGMAFADTASDAMKKGFEAYYKEDYSTAAQWFSKAAEHGDAEVFFASRNSPLVQNFFPSAGWGIFMPEFA